MEAVMRRPNASSRGGPIAEEMATRIEDRKCAFCMKHHYDGMEFSRGFLDILTDANVWASDTPMFVSNTKRVWAHAVCIHFCPLTSFDENTMAWINVSKEYHRARCLACSVCGKRGAAIGCNVSSCNVSVHFPCATQELLPDGHKNWFPCQEPETPFFCVAHSHERAEHERSKEIERLVDLSQGREAIAIPLEIGLAWEGRYSASQETRNLWDRLLLEVPLPCGILSRRRDMDFAYVESSVDSVSVQVAQGPEKSKTCCSCTGPGACRDSSTCECLRDGRSYRWKGRRLDDGHPAQVYECNLNCGCHVQSCRNRLVQKGMACNIDVAFLGLGPSHRFVDGCGKWGVRAAARIMRGSFVCTVAGQLVRASSIEGGFDQEGHHTSVLVHRVGDWSRRSVDGKGDRCSATVGTKRAAPPEEEDAILLDQRRYANLSRYIRCVRREKDANLLRVAVHTTSQDPRAPVLALFAGRDVEEGEELVRSR